MRFLLRVDSHARNHSAHPQAQSQVAALRACAAARSARVLQRRAPRVSLGATCGRRRALHQPCALETWGGLNWEDRFHHNDRSHAQRGGIGASLQRGVVMTRKKAETQRLPDACYDVRPASKQRGHS